MNPAPFQLTTYRVLAGGRIIREYALRDSPRDNPRHTAENAPTPDRETLERLRQLQSL